jgi:hypothetical protein
LLFSLDEALKIGIAGLILAERNATNALKSAEDPAGGLADTSFSLQLATSGLLA